MCVIFIAFVDLLYCACMSMFKAKRKWQVVKTNDHRAEASFSQTGIYENWPCIPEKKNIIKKALDCIICKQLADTRPPTLVSYHEPNVRLWMMHGLSDICRKVREASNLFESMSSPDLWFSEEILWKVHAIVYLTLLSLHKYAVLVYYLPYHCITKHWRSW